MEYQIRSFKGSFNRSYYVIERDSQKPCAIVTITGKRICLSRVPEEYERLLIRVADENMRTFHSAFNSLSVEERRKTAITYFMEKMPLSIDGKQITPHEIVNCSDGELRDLYLILNTETEDYIK